MVNFKTEKGAVNISSEVFTSIAGDAATKCFGVKGMGFRSVVDGIVHLLKRESMSKGVRIHYAEDNSISIELHIIVNYGVNIPVVSSSIINEVKYKVQSVTGVVVKKVDVHIDSMIFD